MGVDSLVEKLNELDVGDSILIEGHVKLNPVNGRAESRDYEGWITIAKSTHSEGRGRDAYVISAASQRGHSVKDGFQYCAYAFPNTTWSLNGEGYARLGMRDQRFESVELIGLPYGINN